MLLLLKSPGDRTVEGKGKRMFGLTRTVVLVAALAVGLVSEVRSQDLFTDMQQVKQDIEELKRQVEELRQMVYSLAKPVPKPSAPPQQPPAGQQPPRPDTKPPDFAKIKPAVCQAVEKYLAALDANLRLTDAVRVQESMSRALAELVAVLNGYSSSPEVIRLLELADEINWDAYSEQAVKDTGQDAQAFKENIARHKKSFRAYCQPK